MAQILKNIFWVSDGLEVNWQWYRSYFSLNYIRYFATWFALAPLFQGVSDLNKDYGQICAVGNCLNVDFNLPFSWWILWIASILFIFAFALYLIYCPGFIKKYSSFSDYESHRHAPRWASWEALHLVEDSLKNPQSYDLAKFVDRLKTKGYLEKSTKCVDKPNVIVEKEQSVLYFSHGGENLELRMPPDRNADSAVHEVVWEIFGRYASSYVKIRIVITYLLRITWLLVLFTIAQNIINGGLMLFNEISIQ